MNETEIPTDHADPYGARIKAARLKAGLSLRAAAEKLGDGTHFTTLGKLEAGKMALSFEWVDKISALYNMTPADIWLEEASDGSGRKIPVFDLFEHPQLNRPRTEWPQFGWFYTSYGGPNSYAIIRGEFSENQQSIEHYVVIDPEQTRLRFLSLYALKLLSDIPFIGRLNEDGSAFDGIDAFTPGLLTVGVVPFTTLGRVVLVAKGYSY